MSENRESGKGVKKLEYNKNGRLIYEERFNGYWGKYGYNNKGEKIYFEDSTGYWVKWKYNKKSGEIYREDSNTIKINEVKK